MEEGDRGPFSAAFGGRERAPVKVSHESMNLWMRRQRTVPFLPGLLREVIKNYRM
jgi:hypothetical protein